MRKLIVAVMISLDGVIQAPGGPGEDRSSGFALGGWAWPYASEGEAMDGLFTRPFALVLGRHTYDIFAGYWPQVASDAPHGAIADAFNAATKHVATDGPDLVIQGSSVLLHQLLAHDVVDELRLLVYPIVLGRGKRLFDDGAQAAAFRLARTRATPTGVIVSRYEREGDVRTGSFAAG